MKVGQLVNVRVAEQYARDVLSGAVVAGKYMKLACQRHFNDLEQAEEKGFWFDREEAQLVLDFFGLLQHSKGEWAGSPILLEPWQQFIVAVVFGWKWTETGTRRFKTVLEFIGRKNGKTTKHSGVALYGMIADGEAGAEIYSAATKKDQARIMFEEACKMRDKSPSIKKHVVKFKNNLNMPASDSKFEPLSSDANSLDGLNVHFGLIDEIHAHKTREVYDILDTATGSRRQPLIWAITTAGYNIDGIGHELYEYGCMVLEGVVEDDTFAAFIFAIDEEDIDNWDDPQVWAKANPNLGVSVKLEDLQSQVLKAKAMPRAKNSFLCKRLNVWVESDNPWMNMEAWRACKTNPDPAWFDGAVAYGGLDLASTSDIAALALLLVKDGKIMPLMRYYLPEETVRRRVQKHDVPYDVWAEQGLITLTPGDVTDYAFIEKDIMEFMEKYDVKSIGYDRWNASQLVNNLMEAGAPMCQFGQGFASMSAPMKELERLVVGKKFELGEDPVLEWMARNVVIKEDEAQNIKPARNKSKDKIDGMVALIMAIGRWMADDQEDGKSVYEQRDMIIL